MVSISLCMIVKNEEAVLARCLNSIKDVVDEIIIVDTGSDDKTKEIASEFTEHVYDFEWINDFSAARNFAFSKATKEMQMWLDADDVIAPDEAAALLKLKDNIAPEVDIVACKYHTHFDEHGIPILTSTRERLFRRKKNFLWHDVIHEYIPLTGNILYSDIAISHKKEASSGNRNLAIYQANLETGTPFSPRETYYYARELMDHGRDEESATYFEQFLADQLGWYEDNIATCFNLSKIYERLGQKEKIFPVLVQSFDFDTPRAEICCQLGYYFKTKQQFKQAIYWFGLALTLKKESIGFVLNDYWDFIPAVELCACYFAVGDKEKSYQYHILSKSFKPDAKSVIFNENYFKSIGITGGSE